MEPDLWLEPDLALLICSVIAAASSFAVNVIQAVRARPLDRQTGRALPTLTEDLV